MKDSKWRDEDIEKLLAQAPKVEDHRSKEDVFKRLQQEGFFKQEVQTKQLAYKKKHYTAYALTAALTCIVAGGVYMSIPSSSDSKSEMSEMADMEMDTFGTTSMDQDASLSEPEQLAEIRSFAVEQSSLPIKSAVYEQDTTGMTPFYIGLAGDDAESVPVTILIPNEEISATFGDNIPTQLELYNTYAPLLSEEELGYADYHPMVGRLMEQADTLIHVLPEQHPYDVASATMAMYKGALVDTFGQHYREIAFQTEQGQPVTFSQSGEPSEPIGLQYGYSYFLDEQPLGTFVVPGFRQVYASVTEALLAMKASDNDVYRPAIIDGIDYEVRIEQEVVITFSEPLDLNAYEAEQITRMLDAMLLTAASFNEQIRFENIVQAEWQSFTFNAPLPKPIGANELPWYYLQKN